MTVSANIDSLNVARLANIPDAVLEVAAVKSKQLEDEAHEKQLANLYGVPTTLNE